MRKRIIKTVCLDFDGVICLTLSNFKSRSIIDGKPISGVKDAVKILRKRYKVKVHSGRCITENGRIAIAIWLEKHGIEVDEVCEHKPMADVFIDDKAIQFRGNWGQTIAQIAAFYPWHQPLKAIVRRRK